MLVFNKKTKKVKNLEPNVAARLIARKDSPITIIKGKEAEAKARAEAKAEKERIAAKLEAEAKDKKSK